MATPKDDLEAVRAVAAALEGFDANEQERIIRWARERLGLSAPPTPPPSPSTPPSVAPTQPTQFPPVGRDFKTFVTEKNPKNDVQFAAAVAFFHRFEAPEEERKHEINSKDLQDACRFADRRRLKHPGQTLRNAHAMGLLDKGTKSGSFTINSVGENLVAMTLPAKDGGRKPRTSQRERGRTKPPAKKKSASKK
jgi:hypothetical protein